VSAFAEAVGYSRAVAVGAHVYVAGTAPVMHDDVDPPADAYGQARRCLEIMVAALAELGAGPRDVVRTRIFLTRAEDIADVGRAHGEVFAEVRPATSAVVVAGLLDPRWLVEIEADAIVA
jgi:enamine deaminase RidA (YjgF/YER057c/UK114 family)